MFKSVGVLRYFENSNKLIVEVDNQLSDYYINLIPKSIGLQKQMFAPHISVIRNEIIPNIEYWNKYQGKLLHFQYENYVYNNETYYWLNVFSSELQNIRQELGLTKTSQITRSPDGLHKFHITLGNLKNKTP